MKMHQQPLSPVRVLLVDDDEDQYVLTRDLLSEATGRFDLEWAPDFGRGLERLAEAEHQVALVDVRLGDGSGLDLLRHPVVRRGGVPIVMLTGDDQPTVDADALEAGAVDFLIKSEVTAPILTRALRYAVERHRAQLLLRQREAWLTALFEDSSDGILLVDAAGLVVFASGSLIHVEGRDGQQLVGRPFTAEIHDEDAGRVRAAIAFCRSHEMSRGEAVEYRKRHGDGRWAHHEATFVNRLSQPGIEAIVVTCRDVSARKRLDAHVAQLAAIVEHSDDAIFRMTLAGNIQSWNSGAEQLFGYSAVEVDDLPVAKLSARRHAWAVPAVLRRVQAGSGLRREVLGRRRDGSLLPIWLTLSPVRDRAGSVCAIAAVAHDITKRKRFAAALIRSEAIYRSTFDDAPVGIAHTSVDGRWLRANHRLQTMLDYGIDALRSTSLTELTHRDDRAAAASARQQLLAGVVPRCDVEERYRRRDGSYLWSRTTVCVHHPPDGAAPYFITVIEDISQQKHAQEELDLVFQLSPDMIATFDIDGRFLRTNPMWSQVLGLDADALRGRPFMPFVHPDDQAATESVMRQLLAGETVVGFVNRYRTSHGDYRWVEWDSKADLSRGILYTVARDQTEKRHLEEQLRQSQKMEAIGRLAGGIAHDFNNLLTAMIGFSELALGSLSEADPSHADVAQVLQLAQNAAGLTHQLLAFSRRQALTPVIVDVGALVGRMDGLLRRVIGDDIVLETATGDGICSTTADPLQLEQVILNLAVNARDAMPTGGRLRLTTSVVPSLHHLIGAPPGAAGPHVRLEVSDTGVGMSPDVLAHVFEPFFTTKEPGLGTGLGLATVYGIVTQGGGFITVDSLPGQGTTFVIYLPCALGAAEPEIGTVDATRPGKGRETILLVEDQDAVRDVSARALQAHGYEVLVASAGPAALTMLERRAAPVHLLLTDVVLPHMSGRALAGHATRIEPGLRVLYMSGYGDDSVERHGVVESGTDFIRKPFRPEQLLARVRDVLDRTNLVRGT